MNAERLEVARRFVACPGWVFLPGMLAASRHEEEQDFQPHRVVNVRIGGNFAQGASGCRETYDIGLRECIPDLDDPVTAAGILPVVRRAWDDSLMFVAYDADSMDYAEVQPFGVWLPRIPGPLPIAVGPTELLALLAALEAAPK